MYHATVAGRERERLPLRRVFVFPADSQSVTMTGAGGRAGGRAYDRFLLHASIHSTLPCSLPSPFLPLSTSPSTAAAMTIVSPAAATTPLAFQLLNSFNNFPFLLGPILLICSATDQT